MSSSRLTQTITGHSWGDDPGQLAHYLSAIRRLRTKHTGKQACIDQLQCLQWLDSRQINSVIYICFGSTVNFNAAQLHEIAVGLEASGQQFI
ncbi:hypothetical protein NL676_013952 [Syzygium grande]|nr:hypothetical protein NL676_013952 [Syzygium grande]